MCSSQWHRWGLSPQGQPRAKAIALRARGSGAPYAPSWGAVNRYNQPEHFQKAQYYKEDKKRQGGSAPSALPLLSYPFHLSSLNYFVPLFGCKVLPGTSQSPAEMLLTCPVHRDV